MNSLQQLVEASPSVFSGAVRESEDSLQSLEATLGVTLPADLRWLWSSCGSGISNAAQSSKISIRDTLRYRAAVALPHSYIVLDDRNDAGTVFLDTNSSAGAVIWVDAHAIHKIAQRTLHTTEHDSFPTFLAWVEFCVEDAIDAS